MRISEVLMYLVVFVFIIGMLNGQKSIDDAFENRARPSQIETYERL